jgi:hypothetical protein
MLLKFKQYYLLLRTASVLFGCIDYNGNFIVFPFQDNPIINVNLKPSTRQQSSREVLLLSKRSLNFV